MIRRAAVLLALAALVGCGLHLPPWPVPSPSATPGPEPTPSAPPTPPAPSPAPPSPMPSATPTPTPSPEPPGNCGGAPCGEPTPAPSPGPVASPPASFNCNGSWQAPSCAMVVSRISASVYYVQRGGQVVQGCHADAKCPAERGDKVFFNSTPRYEDRRCTRGAAIPDNCVSLPAFAYQAEWTGATRDEGENSLGYLASWKADASGSHPVRVCVGVACADVTVEVR